MDQSKTSTQQVATIIKAWIEKGTFQVGDKIPSQRELSNMLGVSRIVIREAIKILEGQGILLSKQGSGIYVQQDEINRVKLFSLGSLRDYQLADVLALANAIWESCTDLIIEHASDDEIDHLMARSQAKLESYSSTTSQQEKFFYESSFGMNICKLTHNPLLYRLMVELLSVTSDFDYQVVRNHPNYKQMIEIDIKLLESIKARDAYRSKFWARERNIAIDEVIDNQETLRKQL
mgnify:CR=1 FL=1|jgi:GntR family transcriptional repressor for pyruvate dehydrogenase complex